MSDFTTRLALQQPVGSDAPAAIRESITANTDILDGSVTTAAGTFADRPAASAVAVGNEYIATDVGRWARSDGTNWHTFLAAGDLKPSAAASPPSGWLLCDGSAVSRTTYAALFAAISTAYGTGDGSTTFNVPDFRGRVILGAGTGSGLTARSIGQTGGAEHQTLTAGEIPPLPLGTGVPQSGTTGWFASEAQINGGSPVVVPVPDGNNETLSTLSQTSNSPSGATPISNMQPYGVANVLIKT